MATIVERFGARVEIAAGLVMRAGSLRDYAALAEFHYLRDGPAMATRVVVMEDAGGGVVERFEERRCAAAAKRGRVVAVLVESLPALCCALREEALGGRYSGWGHRGRGAVARLLNAEVRCISRVVVHPQWRGVGLAVRLVRHALATMTTPYMEALAAMGRVHPFFALAGMKAYRRHPFPRDQRLIDAMRSCGVEAWELASAQRMRGHLGEGGAKPQAAGAGMLRRELRRWAGAGRELEEQLRLARERLLAEPVYYVKKNDE